jgi:hypothetical protein
MPTLKLTGEEIYAIQHFLLNIDTYEVLERCPCHLCDTKKINSNPRQQANSANFAQKEL